MRIVRQPTALEAARDQYIDARQAADEAKRRLELAEQELTQQLKNKGEKTTSKTDGGKVFRMTFSQSHTTQVNEEGLKKSLGAVPFRKICKQVVDKTLLQSKLDSGELSIEQVGPFITSKPSKESIRYTIGVATDEAPDE